MAVCMKGNLGWPDHPRSDDEHAVSPVRGAVKPRDFCRCYQKEIFAPVMRSSSILHLLSSLSPSRHVLLISSHALLPFIHLLRRYRLLTARPPAPPLPPPSSLLPPPSAAVSTSVLRFILPHIPTRSGNGTAIFTGSRVAARYFQNFIKVGQIGINVPIPVLIPYFFVTGSKKSMLSDLYFYGKNAVQFYTRTETITSNWKLPQNIRIVFSPPPS